MTLFFNFLITSVLVSLVGLHKQEQNNTYQFCVILHRLKRLMDLDDEVVTSLRVEGYDISCIQSGVQNQRIPTGATNFW